MSVNKTSKELAIELTTAVVKARADVIATIEHGGTKIQQLETQLNTSEILDIFEKAYSSTRDK